MRGSEDGLETVCDSVSVVVVDDHEIFRQGVVAAIQNWVPGESSRSQLDTSHLDAAQTQPAVLVVGEADDVASGIEVVRRLEPDVVLVDVRLTSGSGAEIISALEGHSSAKFLALSVSDSPVDVLALVGAGARGYVTKRIEPAQLVESIIAVNRGDAVFSPKLAGFVLDAFQSIRSATVAQDSGVTRSGSDLSLLSVRETEVMRFLARGYAYKEIANSLCISIRTVESHASAVLRKLQLSSRNELAHWVATNDSF